jgi:hypothetical protein
MVRRTRRAAEELGITEGNLHYLIRSRKLRPPERDSSGDFIWRDSDLEAARQALRIDRRRKVVPA